MFATQKNESLANDVKMKYYNEMKFANFLHFYQPIDQQPDILEAVVTQSYRPIIKGMKDRMDFKLTLNINGALVELFDKYGYTDLIGDLKLLLESGRLEMTESAKYHAFLPFLSENETVRQINANKEVNSLYFGAAYKPKGFFPPEMAYDQKLNKIIQELGYEWMLLDEIALGGKVEYVDYSKIYKIKDTNLKVFFRDRRISNSIMSAIVRSKKNLIEILKEDLSTNNYKVTAMDGETFGHHRVGHEKLLFEIFDAEEFELVNISDLLDLYPETTEVELIKSTWASSPQDIEKGIQFLSWSDPKNQIHKWQWEFVDLALKELDKIDKNSAEYIKVRKKMDIALASDHFWWASAKPWWSLEMIEQGAFRLLDVIRSISNAPTDSLERARDYYEKIVSTSFDWQRTGIIRKMSAEQNKLLRIPFKERTLEKGGAETGVYYAFIGMLKDLEKKAVEQGEYEQAILWRDAAYKLENKHDIYDAINAIDLVRLKIPHEEVEKTIEEYGKEYKKIRGGQPEQRGA